MGYRLSAIENDLQNIVIDCISNYSEEEKKERINKYSNILKENERLFESYMIKDERLNFIEEYDCDVNFDLMKSDMISLYTEKFSKKGQPGRYYYDRIKLLTDYCPYCLHNEVKQVDHYLPKAVNPTLTVTPINLIPSCTDCNKAKSTTEGFFHPYFDDIDSEQYLLCKISFLSDDIILKFSPEKPESWSDGLYERVENIFVKLNAGHDILNMFEINAKLHFKMHKKNLGKCAQRGIENLKETIEDFKEGALDEIGLNSWQHALFDGLNKRINDVYNYLIEEKNNDNL